MSRRLTETAITSRSARKVLQNGVHWRGLDPDVHIGYRKGPRGGRWLVRWYAGDQKYNQATIGTADDVLSEGTLSYEAAVKVARETVSRARAKELLEALGPPVTVRSAVEAYIDMRDARDAARKGRPARSDASSRLTLHVLGNRELTDVILRDIQVQHLQAWLKGVDPTLKLSTRQRLINDLKAALNLAFAGNRNSLPPDFDKTVKFGLAVEEVVPEGAIVEVRENQILKDEQIRKIIETSKSHDEDGDFTRLLIVLAATGARFSQIRRMLVSDVQVDLGRLLVPGSWKGRKKASIVRVPVRVGSDVLASLAPAIDGRSPSAILLERWQQKRVGVGRWERTVRGPWKSASEMTRRWNEIIDAAGIQQVVPYSLRHSSIVRGIRAGLPIRLVAASHDTSVQIIERHYSRWITDGLEELSARAVIPLVG